jgi:hypothetical protein
MKAHQNLSWAALCLVLGVVVAAALPFRSPAVRLEGGISDQEARYAIDMAAQTLRSMYWRYLWRDVSRGRIGSALRRSTRPVGCLQAVEKRGSGRYVATVSSGGGQFALLIGDNWISEQAPRQAPSAIASHASSGEDHGLTFP